MDSSLTQRDQPTWPPAVGPKGPFGGMAPSMLGVVWMQFFLASIFLGLRLFTRYTCSKWAGWALVWTGISWLVGLVAQILLSVAIGRSLGGFTDTWLVSDGLMYVWTSIFLTFIAIGFSKFAVVAFLLAMQGMTHLRPRYFLIFLAASNMIVDLAFVLFMAFHCSPPYDMWVLGREDSCKATFVAARGFGYFAGTWNAVTDLVLALYPLFLLRSVKIDPGVKRGLTAVMSLGIISFICATIKTWDLRFVTNTAHFNFDIFCLTIWTYTEMWVVLITASIPPLWPLFKLCRRSFTSRVSSAKGWVSSGHSHSTSGYNTARGRSEVLLREKASMPMSRSVAEGGMGAATPDVERSATPAWGHRITGMRSQSRMAREDVSDAPAEEIEMGLTSPRVPDRIMVTTELSVQHETINAEDSDDDPDMRAGWVRRVARDAELGKA